MLYLDFISEAKFEKLLPIVKSSNIMLLVNGRLVVNFAGLETGVDITPSSISDITIQFEGLLVWFDLRGSIRSLATNGCEGMFTRLGFGGALLTCGVSSPRI